MFTGSSVVNEEKNVAAVTLGFLISSLPTPFLFPSLPLNACIELVRLRLTRTELHTRLPLFANTTELN